MRWAFDRIWDALSGLRDVIETFTGWCSRTATDWGTKYIIGPFVFTLMWGLYDIGWRVRWKVIDLRDGLESVGGFLEGIEAGWKLDDLIQALWGGWGSFTQDPKNYILDRAFPLGSDMYWLRQDPRYMIEFWLLERWDWLGGWLYDIKQFTFDRIVDFWPDFYWFYQDPGYMIEFWLTDRVPGLAAFLSNPRAWLREGIEDAKQDMLDTVKAGLLRMIQEVIEANW